MGLEKQQLFRVARLRPVHRPRRARHGHYLCLSAQEYRFPYPCRTLGTTAAAAVSTREGLLDLTDSLDEAAIDKYSYTRDLYMKVRAATPAEGTEDNIDIDELVESAETGAAEPAVHEDSVSETQAEAAGEAETQPGTQP